MRDVRVFVSAHHFTALLAITAESVVMTEWFKNQTPSYFLPDDWFREVIPSSQLVLTFIPSLLIGPPGVVAWLHQKLMYLSSALDVYCSTFTDRVQSETSLIHTHSSRSTRTHRFIGRHRMHPGNTLALLLNLLVLTLTHQSAQLG